jgi:hypothetical protein
MCLGKAAIISDSGGQRASKDKVAITDEINVAVGTKSALGDIAMAAKENDVKESPGVKSLKCSLCGFSAASNSDLVRHSVPCTLRHVRSTRLKEKAKEESSAADLSQAPKSVDKTKTQDITANSAAETNTKPAAKRHNEAQEKCGSDSKCKKITSRESTLSRHMKMLPEEFEVMKCKQCDFVAISSTGLKIHDTRRHRKWSKEMLQSQISKIPEQIRLQIKDTSEASPTADQDTIGVKQSIADKQQIPKIEVIESFTGSGSDRCQAARRSCSE